MREPARLGPLTEGRADRDQRRPDTVAKANRIRLTERLRLEPIGPAHAGDLWRLHQDEAVAAWYLGRWTAQMAQQRAAGYGQAWEADGVSKWLAYDRRTGELVGRGGLSRVTLIGRRRLEVGWALRGDRWGRGYATEIGQAGLDFGWDDLGAGEVVAFTEPHNRRSRAVMERLGMSYAGPLVHQGEPFVLYTITRAAAPGSGRRT
jgi:RimJ/RimL family protein N-acetyltransferase